MTRDETKTIIRAIMACYPTFKPDNLAELIDVWHLMLEDQDYKLISMALKSYVRTNNSAFAPSIGQLMDYTNRITNPEELTGAQAWGLVMRAIRNSSYNSVSEFAKLPETIQKAVGSPEQLRSMAIDCNFNEGVASSNFQKSYNIILNRENEMKKVSSEVLQLINGINEDSPQKQLEKQNAEKVQRLQANNLLESKEYIPMPDEVRERMRGLLGVR